jgi:magnesium transporter
MARKKRNPLKPKGTIPGSLILQGETKVSQAVLHQMVYDAEYFNESTVALEGLQTPDSNRVTWVDLSGLHDVQMVSDLGKWVGLSNLQIEDVLNTDHRPKFEWRNGVFFGIIKMVYRHEGEVIGEQISLAFHDNKVVTFQEQPGDVFDPIRDRLRTGMGTIRKRGADYLCYALMDVMVDHYLHVMDHAETEMEEMDDILINQPTNEMYMAIQQKSKGIAALRRLIEPFRDAAVQMNASDDFPFAEDTRVFMHDLGDHLVRCLDVLERMRETAQGLKDLFFNAVSVRMNRVMQMLTLVSAVFIPITFLAGIYGMNFDHMPELHHRYGYFWLLGVMFSMAVGMVYYFYRRGWLK